MSKIFTLLFAIALFIYFVAGEESESKTEKKSKSENPVSDCKEDTNDNNEFEIAKTKFEENLINQNLEAAIGYLPLYYEYVPIYEVIEYET